MISPFDGIDKAIRILKELLPAHKNALKDSEYDQSKEPEWFKRLVNKNNLELIENFKRHGHKTAASFYAEVIIGASPSKGCEKCMFFHSPFSSESNKKRCNLTGKCRPLDKLDINNR